MAVASMALVTSYSVHARSDGVAVGGAYHYSSDIYKDTDSHNEGFPLISYRGEHVYFQGVELGVGLMPLDAPHNILWQVTYDGRHFDPDDSDNAAMQGLNERHATGLTGPELRYSLPVGQLAVKAALEFTNEHHGYLLDASWLYSYRFQGATGLTTQIGYQYNSSKMTNYLYGVSESESAQTGITSYDVGGAGAWYAALGGFAELTSSIRLFAGAKLTYFDKDIYDSPIVTHDVTHSLNVGVAYRF